MFTADVAREIGKAAVAAGIETAALLAIAEVESAGKVFATVDGKPEPLIRFEGHYFDQRLSGAKLEQARAAGLASPKAGAVANPAGQAARWKLLERAAAIDRKAAYESVSWGLGQVMGAHWSWLGFASVDALVAEARRGASGQAALMCRFIVKAGLADALRRRDWEAFARGYNGPAYRRNAYHTKLAAAYRRHAGGGGAGNGQSGSAPLVSIGQTGEQVRSLQEKLVAAGHDIAVDGAFGPFTRDAVIAFQRRSGLAVDGIAGPLTIGALDAAASAPQEQPTGQAPGMIARMIDALQAFLGRFVAG